MTDSVTVVIPTYNRRALLPRAIDSVLAQTHKADEIIVIDDGSTDGTAEIVARDYPQIVLLRQENRGVSAARNTAIRASSNMWIALLDSDDEWLPTKLERQLEVISGDASAVLCHSNEIWIRDGRRVNPGKRHRKSGGWIFQKCLPLCAISPSAALIRRALFDTIGFFNEGMPVCEDYDMWLRVCSRYAVHYIDESLVIKYGGHDDQLSRRYWGMDRWRVEALERIIDARGLSDEARRAAAIVMVEKINVYLEGARKRDKHDDVATFQAKRDRALRLSCHR